MVLTCCVGDKPRFGPFQPCFASTHNVQQNFIILPNGYSQFSVLQSFVWKRKCTPTLVLLSSGCYSKRERETRRCGRWIHVAFSADLLFDFFLQLFSY